MEDLHYTVATNMQYTVLLLCMFELSLVAEGVRAVVGMVLRCKMITTAASFTQKLALRAGDCGITVENRRGRHSGVGSDLHIRQ